MSAVSAATATSASRAWRVSLFRMEAVTNPGLRDDELRPNGILFDLAAQSGNENAEVLARISARARPDGVEQLLVRDRAVARSHEHAQDFPLRRREVHPLASPPHGPLREIDLQLANMQRRAFQIAADSPQVGAHARL